MKRKTSCSVCSKINKPVIKSQMVPTRRNVISVKVGRNVTLLFISIYIEKTMKWREKIIGFAILESHEFRTKFPATNLHHTLFARRRYLHVTFKLNFEFLLMLFYKKYVSVVFIIGMKDTFQSTV